MTTKSFQASSLRFRLILLVLIAIIPALVLILYDAWENRGSQTQEIERNVQGLARFFAGEQQRIVDSTRQLLVALAQLPEVGRRDGRACSALFAKLQTQYSAYLNFGAVDPDGTLFCSAIPIRNNINLAERAYFRRVLETREFAVGDYQVGLVTGRPTLNFGYPVLDDKKNIQAVVFAALDLKWLSERIVALDPPKGSSFTFLDEKGTILVRHPEPEKWIGQSVAETQLFKAVTARHDGAIEAVGFDGLKRLYAFATLKERTQTGSLYVAVGIPRGPAVQQVNRAMFRDLGWLGLVAALALVASRLIGDRFIVDYVDQRISAEERLGASEEKFRALAETASDAIISADSNGDVTYFNKRAERIFGYAAAEVIGQSLAILMPEKFQAAHQQGLKRFLSTGEARLIGKSVELTGKRKDGAEFPLELSLANWRAGGEVFFTAIIRDITERKEAEKQLRQQQRRVASLHEINLAITSSLELETVLRLLLEKIDFLLPTAAATVWLFNDQTGELEPIASRNIDEEKWKAGYRLYKGTPGRGLGKSTLESKGPLVVKNVATDPRTGNRDLLRETGLVSYLGIPLVAREEVLGVIGLFTGEDHEFGVVEIELATALAGQAALAIYHSRLYEQTKRQAIALAEANSVQADFTAMIVHDLRSPLAAVMSAAEMIEDGILGAVTPEQKRWLGKIQQQAEKVVDLVSDYLVVSKIEAGYLKLSTEPVNLNSMIRGAVENYTPLARGKKITLCAQVDPAIAEVQADALRLEQVFSNLLGNAIKFTGEGGTIEVGASRQDGAIKVWVKDNGAGIPAAEIADLFQKYQQTTSGKISNRKGTGLGLLICKMIVEGHGGKIWAESEEGKGTTFFFTLPNQ